MDIGQRASRGVQTAPTFIDLFCGAGGLSEGFAQAGWRPLLGTDVDPDALATYSHNFPGAAVIGGDIRRRDVRRRVLAEGRGAHLVAGGPPCQAFSQVRNHSRVIDDPRNSLYKEFVAIIRSLEPLGFVMENVPGMAQVGVHEQVLSDLSCGGAYRVASSVVDAADFGVPETRQRLVFVGVHASLAVGPPKLSGTGATRAVVLARRAGRRACYRPSPTGAPGAEHLLARLVDPWDETVVSAAQAIDDLVGLARGRFDREVPAADLPAPSSAYEKMLRDGAPELLANAGVPRMNADTELRLRQIPPGGNYLDLPERLMVRYLTGQAWGPHNGTQRLSRRHYYAYRRLHPDMWAWTLNTKADSAYHWSIPRALSVREFARLQSFPDRFVFTTDPHRGPLEGRVDGGPGHSCYRQVGNAVPPLLGRAFAAAMAETLGFSAS